MFNKKKVNTTIELSSANIVSIEGYTPDPANNRPYVVTSGGKLNVLTVAGFEKKPIRTLIALASLSADAPEELQKVTGGMVIVIDKKLEKMAKHRWSRSQVLAAIEYQCQMTDAMEHDIDPRISCNIAGVSEVLEATSISAQIVTGEKYGYKAITKICKKQNGVMAASEKYAIKKLHKAFKKASKTGESVKNAVGDVTAMVEDLTEAVAETVETATKQDTQKESKKKGAPRSGEVADPVPAEA